jgi:hypothetical protein
MAFPALYSTSDAKLRLLLVAWFMLGSIAVALGHGVAPVSVQRSPTVSYPRPPSRLDDLVRSSDVIVFGEIGSSRQTVDDLGSLVRPVFEHKVWTMDVFRGDTLVKVFQPIFVRQVGGTIQHDGREVRLIDPGFPILPEGKRYLFVLNLDKKTNSYVPTFGPASVYITGTGQAVILPAARAIDAFHGRDTVPFVEFLTLFREAIRRVG